MKLSTSKWASKAEAELQGATTMRNGTEPLHDLVCFHAQQSAEKCDNAVLVERSTLFPKTHDLDASCRLAQAADRACEVANIVRVICRNVLSLASEED